MEEIAAHFTWIDWSVVCAYLAFSTWIGHLLKGKQSNIQDFFLAGRNLPWPAVTGSIIATAISAITFVGVPSMVFAAEGNWMYLQFAIGSIIARIIVAKWFVPAFYESEIYSPYEYMEKKLGAIVGKFTAFLFFIGSSLGQGVRVYMTALVLEVVTGWQLYESIALIGVFAILWTWMGGMATVIWTDVVQFFVFIVGGVFTIAYIVFELPFSSGEAFEVANSAGKLTLWNFTTDPRVAFSLTAAIVAMPFQNLAAYGTDQLNAQRMFCCKGPKEASKAILWSCTSELITLLMLAVGAMLFVYFESYPLTSNENELVQENGNRIYPIFIVAHLPVGLSGLLIAAIFAAAISSLDSILAALSQTSVTTFYRPLIAPGKEEKHYLFIARLFVLVWGVLLCGVAWAVSKNKGDLVSLALSLTAYTYGPLLGAFLIALMPGKRNPTGLIIGIPLSMIAVYLFKHQEYFFGIPPQDQIAWPWLFPLGCLIVFFFGFLFAKKIEN